MRYLITSLLLIAVSCPGFGAVPEHLLGRYVQEAFSVDGVLLPVPRHRATTMVVARTALVIRGDVLEVIAAKEQPELTQLVLASGSILGIARLTNGKYLVVLTVGDEHANLLMVKD